MLLNSAAFDDALSAFGICVTLFVIRSVSVAVIHMSLKDCRTAALSFCALGVCADSDDSLMVRASPSPVVLTLAFSFRSVARNSSSINKLLQILSRSVIDGSSCELTEADADAGADIDSGVVGVDADAGSGNILKGGKIQAISNCCLV